MSWALELGEDGSLLGLFHLQKEVPRGKKTALVPQELLVPQPVKRSSGVAANFLCDTSSYLLGADSKGKPDRAAECFAAAAALHRQRLDGAQSAAARAILAFFDRWDPVVAPEHPALQQDWPEICKGGNLIFWYKGHPVTEEPEIQQRWQQAQSQAPADTPEGLCLVTGSHVPLARLHPNIKGVAGAQSSGAALVSFNAAAFCSYGHEQGTNAPTGEYAAFAYTTALNQLLSDREHIRRVGDTTLVCWAAGGQSAYQDFLMDAFYDDAPTEQDIRNTLFRLAEGLPVDWQDQRLDPDTRFYILGAGPQRSPAVGTVFLAEQFRHTGPQHNTPLRAAGDRPPRLRQLPHPAPMAAGAGDREPERPQPRPQSPSSGGPAVGCAQRCPPIPPPCWTA